MGALKPSSITLHRGGPLLLFVLDGLHHYPNVVFLCVLTRATLNIPVSSFTFHVPSATKRKKNFVLVGGL